MKRLICYVLSLVSLTVVSCFSHSAKAQLNVNIVYDEPVNGYQVSGEFYPFGDYTETGQVKLDFIPLNGGPKLSFSNVGQEHPDYPLKFTGKNICAYVFAEDFSGFHDGDTLHFHYPPSQRLWADSPLLYDAEFQFFDVDFDGKDEFLLNDYYQGKCGNFYTVYEITPKGFVLREGELFDWITNLTVFDSAEKRIDTFVGDEDERRSYYFSSDGEVISSLTRNEETYGL